MEKKLERFGWETIVSSVFLGILGILLTCFADTSLYFIETILGLLFIIVGILKIVDYITVKGKYDFYNYDAFYGFITIIFGLIIVIFKEQFNTIFRTLISVWIIYSGILKLLFATKINMLDKTLGVASMLTSVIMIIIGILVLIFENTIIVSVGVLLIMYSIMDIVSGILYINNVKKIYKAMKKNS